MSRALLGFILLAGVAGVVGVLSIVDLSSLTRQVERRTPVEVSVFFGGEKSALLQNPKVTKILEDRYRITLSASKAGSVEMATTLDTTGRDCIWPSNLVAVELAKQSGKPVLSDTTIFNSPIVFFAWDEVADALEQQGVVTRRNDGFLTADVAQLVQMIQSEARWQEDLGLNIYGRFRVFSTHPAKSNSGNIWSGLLATALNGGSVATDADLPRLLPQIKGYFEQMGHMEASSGDIFGNFLKQGMGSRPIIVGYENQMIEFLNQNAAAADMINARIRVLYPEPTVFASHPLISLSPDCARLAEALTDPELQAIAWADHGFRTGLIGVENDPADITAAKLPESISLVVPMPTASTMSQIINTVE